MSYTLYSHSPEASDFCIANVQICEDSTGTVVIERTLDSTNVDIYTSEFSKLLLDFQHAIPKGVKVALNIVNLNEQEIN